MNQLLFSIMYTSSISASPNHQHVAAQQNPQAGVPLLPLPYVRHGAMPSDAPPPVGISVAGHEAITNSWQAMYSYAAAGNAKGGRTGSGLPLLKNYFENVIRHVPCVDATRMSKSVRLLEGCLGFGPTNQKIAMDEAQRKFDVGMKTDGSEDYILGSLKKTLSKQSGVFVLSLRKHFSGCVFNSEAAEILHRAAKSYVDSGGDLNQVKPGESLSFLQTLNEKYVSSDADRNALRVFLNETPDHVEERSVNGPSIVLHHGAVEFGQQAAQALPTWSSSGALERQAEARKRPFDQMALADQRESVQFQFDEGSQTKKQRTFGPPTTFTRMPYEMPTDCSFSGGADGAGRSNTGLFLHGSGGHTANSATSMPPWVPGASEPVAFQSAVPTPVPSLAADSLVNTMEFQKLLNMFPVDPFPDVPNGIGATGPSGSGHAGAAFDPSALHRRDTRFGAAPGNLGDLRPSHVDGSSGYVPYSIDRSAPLGGEFFAAPQYDVEAWNTGPFPQSSLPPMPSFEEFLRDFDANRRLQDRS